MLGLINEKYLIWKVCYEIVLKMLVTGNVMFAFKNMRY